MSITLDNNIEVNYDEDKSYIIETVKSDLYRRNENLNNIISSLQVAPVTPCLYIENGTNNVYAVESYTYSGAANTKDFTRVFPTNTTCDILIVGGGGAGGRRAGGGGGAGALIYHKNQILNGTYTIKVGKGGRGVFFSEAQAINNGRVSLDTSGYNGEDSQFIKSDSTKEYLAKGGAGGHGGFGSINNTGGSAGGGNYGPNTSLLTTQNKFNNSIVNIISSSTYDNTGLTYPEGCYGRRGGIQVNNYKGGGGGGAGGAGMNHAEETTVNDGYGGLGLAIDITGTSVVYAGGGNGSDHLSTISQVFDPAYPTIESRGGGGFGSDNGIPQNGLDGTGGGGGGQGSDTQTSGAGGSGIVIIRYLLGTIPATNLLTTEPVVVAPTFTETIRSFIHSGGAEAQTTHTITIGRNTICDILIVGGGGGGGLFGGGGGAGSILFANNLLLNAGSYTIKVGKGGTGASNDTANGTNGIDSSILINAIEYISKGGGGGGSRQSGAASFAGRNGSNGGSGGGGSSSDTIETIGGSTTTNTYKNWETYGNAGGKGKFGSSPWVSGGGGGAGSAGSDWSNTKGGNGGSGKSFVSYFGTNVGHNGWFGGGGGGNMYWPGGTFYDYGYGNGGNGLSGGGGNGANETNVEISATGGLPNTGGGGGGGKWDGTATNGGNGGSGIVIIKFKSTTAILDGITHKRLNFAYNNDNLVAWYKFNGDYLDSSGNGHNLTNVGTVIQSTHIIEGQAVEFDSTDYLEFPATINPYTIWNGKGITFSFWVRFTAHSTLAWARLIDFQTSASMLTGFLIAIKGTTQALHIRMNNNFTFDYSNLSNSIITTLGVWHHFVWSIDVAGKWDVYLNNVRINNNEVQGIPNITYNLRYINKSTFTGDGVWGGQMDDFRIYDRALSATDVSLLYNKTYPIPNLYALNFPVPTIADINNNSNIVLRGAYDIALSTSNALIIPKAGQYIPQPTTFTNYSVERMYPPVRNFTAATTTLSGQTYGNGTYVVSYSSTYGSSIDPWNCFNTANPGGAWPNNRYTAGTFNSTSFIVAGYLGDWLKIQLPVAIKLTRFEILMRTDGTQEGRERSPKDFKIYGSNDNITWVELVNKTDAVYNASYKYVQTTPEITNTYTYYGLVVNKLVGTSILLNFDEWYIYGQEVLTSSLSLRYHLLNPVLDPIGAQWTYSSSNTNVYHMGSVGIGTTNPSYTLDVRGNIFSSTGGFTQSGLTTWSIASDRRIKENIVKASYEKCLENVKNIELYNFNFKDNYVSTNDRHQLGFIAQEVQQVYPKAVEVGKMMKNMEEKIEGLLTLNTTQIDYTLYGAVKGLIQKLENIKIKIERIKSTSNITIQ